LLIWSWGGVLTPDRLVAPVGGEADFLKPDGRLMLGEQVGKPEGEAVVGADVLQEVGHAAEVVVNALGADAAYVDPFAGEWGRAGWNYGDGPLEEAVVVSGDVAYYGNAVEPVFEVGLIGEAYFISDQVLLR
jgi:hypothetical protein